MAGCWRVCLDVYPHKLKDTTNLADTKNYVFRGKVISLGKDKKVSICYDVEHMRVAGAWVGKPMAFSADKNMGPTVEGEMLFATKPGPGWAKDGKWDDPREGKEGPLPRDWAHYKGLYVHGDKVVTGGLPLRTRASELAVSLRLGPADVDRKIVALRAQASQTTKLFAALGEEQVRLWWSTETFVAAHAARDRTQERGTYERGAA